MLRKPVPRNVATAPGASVAGAIDSIVGATDPAGAATVRASVPVTPSLSAVIVVGPGLVAISRPDASTVATSDADELHVTFRPSSSFPLWSRSTTVSGVVSPATGGVASGAIVTANTGTCVTETIADPDLLSTLALIVVVPAPVPVTTPAVETVATAAFAEAHVSVLPGMASPFSSRTSAESASVPPTCSDPPGDVTTIVVTTGPIGPPGSGDVPCSPPHASRATRGRARVSDRIGLNGIRKRNDERSGWACDARVSDVAGCDEDPPAPVARHTAPQLYFGDSLVWRRPLKTATFDTNRGTITAELYDQDAPKTVEN